MEAANTVRLGIVGMGAMGNMHARNIQMGLVPEATLTAVADAVPERLAPHDGMARFNSAREMIESGLIDAILIATPHYSHTTIGIEALRAGLHVLVEKPISVHKADCEKLIAAYEPSRGQVFAAMFNQRTDPRYRKLKAMLDAGVLGAVQRINWIITDWFRTEEYYRSGDWRATWAGEGGGVLLNQCPHQLDLWQWLFGMPERVIARCQLGRFHDIEVEDSVTALLEYASGTQGVFVTTTGEAPGTNRLEVVGENGKVVIEGRDRLLFTRNEVSSVEFSRRTEQRFDRPEVWHVEIPTPGEGDQHHGILRNFARAILGREALLAPAVEGIHSVELGNAMLLSSIRDCPIQLPMDAEEYAAELKKKIESSTFEKKAASTKASAATDFSRSFGR